MILLSTSASLLMYLVCSLALLVLMHRGQLAGSRRSAGLAVVGVLGAAYSLWAIAGAGGEALAWGLVLLVAGLPLYAFTRRLPARPRAPA